MIIVKNKKGENEKLLSANELLEILEFKKTWLYDNIKKGLPRYLNQPPRFLLSDVMDWLRSLPSK